MNTAQITAAVQAKVDHGVNLLLRKDTAEDWRAAVEIRFTPTLAGGIFTPSPTRPDPVNGSADWNLHFAHAHNFTFVNDFVGFRGLSDGIPGTKAIIDWNTQFPDTIVHEIGHLIGLDHNETKPASTIHHIMREGPTRSPSAQLLLEFEADAFSGV